jgi:hypothetical protein
MSIVKDSLAEEILSRQERAVIRGIYRAAQLREALVELRKTVQVILPEAAESAPNGKDRSASVVNTKYKDLEVYLAESIDTALVSTKVPAHNPMKTKSSTLEAKL